MKVSIVIPTFNEAEQIQQTLLSLQAFRTQGHEVIVSDGGSTDGTLNLAVDLADRCIASAPGRASQMNAGAAQASGDLLLFLHADTQLPDRFLNLLKHFESMSDCAWGRFDVRLSGSHPGFRVIETLMNFRSRVTGIATGDQALFVRREVFQRVGGFADMPLMEDVEISRRLKRASRPFCIRTPLLTSSRRWETRGILNTILLMWWLRLQFYFGVSPHKLARQYR